MSEIATQDVARARAAMIRAGIQNYLHTLAHIAAAYQQRDWKALGYDSWDGYVDGEYSEHRLKLSPEHRQKAVAELRLAGMSQRAIGSALGVDQATVIRDLRRGDADASPDEIKGADGKTYASTRPTRTATGAQFGAPVDGAADAVESDQSAPARPGPVEGSPGPGRVTPTTATGVDLGPVDATDDGPAWTPSADAAPDSDGQKTPESGVTPDRKQNRRPLPDAFRDSTWDLVKVVERLDRLTTDDRFPRNAKQVARMSRGDLLRAVDLLAVVVDRLHTSMKESTE